MRAHRILPWIGGAAVGIVISASVGTALAGYSTGNAYSKASPAYQLGYAAGAIDMLAAIDDGKFLKPGSFNDNTNKIVKCLVDKKLKQKDVRAAYLKYLETFPKQKPDNAASNIFEAMKIGCRR